MFQVGQKVVCVNAKLVDVAGITRWRPAGDLSGLKDGEVYTVRFVGLYDIYPCIWLKEIVRPIHPKQVDLGEPGFAVERFRPLEAA